MFTMRPVGTTCAGQPSTSTRQQSRTLNRQRGGAAPAGDHGRRLLAPPCRITNTSDEIYRAKGLPTTEDEGQGFIEIDQMQVHNPELGRLENRVGKFYLQELFEDSGVDLEETAYWFHTPPGGWDTEPERLQIAPQAPVTFPEPGHTGADAQGRTPLADLDEGAVITGIISDCWLYHGIQVDFGAEFDGLVPIYADQWMEPGVREALTPGETVKARVHKVRRAGLYIWPVQLELMEPANIAVKLLPPSAYDPPISHEWCSEQGWTTEQICEATGRFYAPSQYFIREDDADLMQEMQEAYGFDDEGANYATSPDDLDSNREILVDRQPYLNSLAAEIARKGI